MKTAQPKPQPIAPYLCCKDAARAIDFYKKAFGATEEMRFAEPSGRIGHAQLRIGDAMFMLSDEYPEMDVRSPQSIGGSAVGIHIYVDDVDALAKQAVAAGAELMRPVADQFYGDRSAILKDPFGHRWFFATRKEELSNEELQKRYADLISKQPQE
jgi:PhnB protein